MRDGHALLGRLQSGVKDLKSGLAMIKTLYFRLAVFQNPHLPQCLMTYRQDNSFRSGY